MSNETEPQPEGSIEEPQVQTIDALPGVDWLLADMVRLAELGLEVPVTLSVGGLLISGQVISGKKYIEEFGTIFDQAMSEKSAELMKRWINSWGFMYEESPEEAEAPGVPRPRSYIHIRRARYFVPGQKPIPNSGGILWRGRLESIDGFNWGTLEVG